MSRMTPRDWSMRPGSMYQTEKMLWQRMKFGILGAFRGDSSLIIERVENVAMRGMADFCGVWKGREFWCELKIRRAVGARVVFQAGQVGWLAKRCRAGSRAFILVATPGRILELYWGADAPRLDMVNGNAEPLWTHVGDMGKNGWRGLVHAMAWGADPDAPPLELEECNSPRREEPYIPSPGELTDRAAELSETPRSFSDEVEGDE